MEALQHKEYHLSALNDLIRINNDRITGYENRLDFTLDTDLENIFLRFIYQSRQNIFDITRCISYLGGKPDSGTKLSGKFYHAWTDLRSKIIKQNRQTLLDYCEYTEDVAKSAYRKALDDNELHSDKNILVLLKTEFEDLKRSHSLIMGLRNDLNNTAA